ncbi:MAG: 6-bladed beta-propeller [Acidobacteriota bacterium]|nr:6-bladed beta-propeller [Acidobacteriota bacterium]
MTNKQIAVSEDHRVFLLDTADRIVLRFDKNGKRTGDIGGPGQGPGEYTRPLRIQWFQDSLLVYDRGRIHQHDPEGSLETTHHPPSGLLIIHRVTGGWVVVKRAHRNSELVLFDPEFKSPTVLRTWESPPSEFSGGFDTILLNPVSSSVSVLTDRHSRFVCLKTDEQDTLHLFDLKGEVEPRTIELSIKPVAFNREWGKRYLEEFRTLVGKDRGLIYKAKFPEYFPKIQGMFVSADDLIVVTPWTGAQDLETPLDLRHGPKQAFRFDGSAVAMTEVSKAGHRIAAVIGPYVYVILRTKQEDYTVARVPGNLLSGFLKEHPLPAFTLEDFVQN